VARERRAGRIRARGSLRLRITAGALVFVVAALSGAGVLLIHSVQRNMRSQIDTTLRANADFTERSISSGQGLPTREGPTDLYVQFLAPNGRVLGASTSARGLPALAPARSGASAPPHVVGAHNARLGDLRVLASGVPNGPTVTLVVARSAASVVAVHDSLVRLLVILVVAGSALLGTLIWIVVGRALRPVEVMRQTVNAISERDLEQRLAPPGTGDELDRLADTLNDLLVRLERALTRERQFVADASHELRTPISAVRALLETEPADLAAVISIRAEALDRLGHLQDLVDDLLVLARADAAVDRSSGLVDLDELVLGLAGQLARTTNLQIDTSQVSGGQVVGRDTELGRVIENLATNAARHARTTVAFSVRHVDGTVELSVSDDGPGIPVADRTRIFERFRTLDDSRTAGRGAAGLGLSIASAIVIAHHGTLAVDDAVGPGARLVVRLPAETPVSAVPTRVVPAIRT
jgi:signal transduction histidine kinase